jgi:amino acid adenylation domain-containing protein
VQADVTDISVLQARKDDQAHRDLIDAVAAQWTGPRRSGPEMFEEHARLRSEKVAVKAQGSSITYDELNRWANRIARAVIERIGSDQQAVAVPMGNDIPHMASMLGVMKSNNIFVAINPDDPPDRAAQITDIADAKLFIAKEEWFAEAGDFDPDGVEVVRFEHFGDGLSEANLDLKIDPESFARLIFTSGSTGAPKGVPKEHWKGGHDTLHPYSAIGPNDVVSQLAPPNFAAGVAYIDYALLAGGTLCLYDVRKEGLHRVADWINENEITFLGMGPSLFRRLFELVPEGVTFPSVRVVTTGGEALLKGDVELYKRHFSRGSELHNLLASTEADIVTRYLIDHDTVIEDAYVPVGYPDSDVDLILLDDDGQEVGFDQQGMLYVRSPRNASGYWKNAEQTAKSFVPDPTGGPGVVYRTGDMAILKPDGCLHFLGRRDFRVKVRGYGVDLTEVERALLGLPGVKEAAVVPQQRGDENRLVAYLSHKETTGALSQNDVRSALLKQLPDYAVPTAYVILDALPLTDRGKVDRRALPDVDEVGPTRHGKVVPPRDDTERGLVAIWQHVLGAKEVGIEDHFFDELGGTSIQGLQTFAEMATRMDLDLSPTLLLEAPTIAQLSEVIKSGAGHSTYTSLVPIRATGDKTPFFCVHGGGGGAFFVRDIANHIPEDRPVYGLQAAGFSTGTPGVYRPVEEIAARYLAEIRDVQPDGPYLLGGLSFGGIVAYEMAQQLRAKGEETALLALLDTKLWTLHEQDDPDDPRRHVNRMKRMGNPAQKAWYVIGGVGRRAYRRYRQFRVYLGVRAFHKLPKDLRKFHYFPLFSQANREYSMAEYPGDVLFISEAGSREEQLQDWTPYVKGAIEMHEIDAGHFDLVVEPYVAELAGYLVDAFDRIEP